MPPRPARRKHLRIEALVGRNFLADVGQLLLNALELNVRTGAGGGVRKSKAGAGWLRAYLCRLVAVAVADELVLMKKLGAQEDDEDEDAKDEEDTGTALLKSHVGEIQSFDPAPCSVTMQCKSFAN